MTGLAEELLRLFIRYGDDTLPRIWKDPARPVDKGLLRPEKQHPVGGRYATYFSPASFQMDRVWKPPARLLRAHSPRAVPFHGDMDAPQRRRPLLCLEPCTSVQPGDRGCTRMEDRFGNIVLAPGETWERGFSVSFY